DRHLERAVLLCDPFAAQLAGARGAEVAHPLRFTARRHQVARAVDLCGDDGDVLFRAGRAAAYDERRRTARTEAHSEFVADVAHEERRSEVRHGATVVRRAFPNYVHAVTRRLRWLVCAGALASVVVGCGGGDPVSDRASSSSAAPIGVPHVDESTTTPFLLTT